MSTEWGTSLALWAFLISDLAGGEPPLATEIPHLATLTFPNLDFEDGTKDWRISGGRSGVARKAGRRESVALRLSEGGMASRSLTVSRGSENMLGRRYLMCAWVRSEVDGARGSLTLRGVTCTSRGSQEWERLEAIVDTGVRTPGSTSESIALSLSAGKSGSVLFDDVAVYWIPAYGIHVRFKVTDPPKGKFNSDAYVIRRHRDTSHRDSVRHRYFSGGGGLGGGEGTRAGEFSPWFDLRRHLFGTWLSTVTVTLHKQEPSQPAEPITAVVELSFAPTVSRHEGRATEGPGGAFELGEAEADPAREFEPDDKPAPASQSGGVFFRCTHRSSNGRFAFLMPESDITPSRFLRSIQSIDQEVKERYRWTCQNLPAPSKRPSRIAIGANISALGRLLGRESIRNEMEILARIGLNSISRGASPETAIFDQLRLETYGLRRLYDRMYYRVGKDEVCSPYDGDRLAATMDRKFARLAEDLRKQSRAARDAVRVVELMDEPPNYGIAKVDLPVFREFMKGHGLTPQLLGATTWGEVLPHGYSEQADEEAEAPEDAAAAEVLVAEEDDDFLERAEQPEQEPAEPEAEPALDVAKPPLTERRLLYYTRLFSAKKTSDLFKTATVAVEKHLPGVRTSVNFRSGVRRVLTTETADWFQVGRDRAVTMMWNEDWLNTYGWRRNGIQLVSYYAELMRTAARKHGLPVGGFLIMMGHPELKSYSALAHGSRYLHYWRYGPSYANYLPYSWSHSRGAVRAVATVSKDVARIEDTLCDGRREPAPVALLYAKADPLWGRSQAENRLVYFGLLHDQIPVDLITEAEIEEDEILSRYKFLYVTDTSVRRASLRKIADWVRGGGSVWLSGGAGTRDELDEPAGILMSALGVGSVEIKEQTKRLVLPEGEPPAAASEVYQIAADDQEAVTVRFEDGSPAQVVGKAGKGQYCVCAFRPGVLYEGTVRPHFNRYAGKGRIQKGWSQGRRDWITRFALQAGLVRPVQVDRPCVEVALYRHSQQDLAMFLDYTGEGPIKRMRTKVKCTRRISSVESLRRGRLDFTQEGDWVSFGLPLELTDSALLR